MIHVTQGHENGVGLEIFIKSLICLNKSQVEKFVLHVCKEDLINNLNLLNLNYNVQKSHISINNKIIKCKFFTKDSLNSNSLNSLLEALKTIRPDDILLTLPTSKDQLLFEGNSYNG